MFFKCLFDKYRNVRSKYCLWINRLIYRDRLQLSDGVYVRKNFNIVIENNGKIKIGKNVFFNNDCSLNSIEEIEIGDDCIFGENVHIYDHNHIYSDTSIPVNNQGFTSKAIHIGNNSWIGSNVTILKGVSIGSNCVIGANCVIFKDVPDKAIVKVKQNLIITNK